MCDAVINNSISPSLFTLFSHCYEVFWDGNQIEPCVHRDLCLLLSLKMCLLMSAFNFLLYLDFNWFLIVAFLPFIFWFFALFCFVFSWCYRTLLNPSESRVYKFLQRIHRSLLCIRLWSIVSSFGMEYEWVSAITICLWISMYPNTICWKDVEVIGSCKKSVVHGCVRVILELSFNLWFMFIHSHQGQYLIPHHLYCRCLGRFQDFRL